MKKRFFILSLMISLCIMVSCANGSSSTSKEEEKERDYSCSVRIVNMIAQENEDFYETNLKVERCKRGNEASKVLRKIIEFEKAICIFTFLRIFGTTNFARFK